MRSFILFLKRVGLRNIVGVFIAIVLIIVASIYFSTRPDRTDIERQALFDESNYTKNIAELEKQIQKDPNDLNLQELLAASYIQKADAEPLTAKWELVKAVNILNKIVKSDQTRSETYRLIGTARLYQNNLPAAEASFNKAIQISDKGNLNARAGLGMIAEHKGEWTKALNIYKAIINEKPSHEMAMLGIGRYYIYKNNANIAKKSVDTLPLTTKNNAIKGEAYAILGSADMLIRDFIGAAENFKKSLTYRPGNVHTAVLLGEAYVGQYAISPAKDRATILQQITDSANKAILIKPDYIYAYTLLYKVHLFQNRYEEANQVGKKIISLLATDKILTESQKIEYKEYYSGEIKSVTITSLKTTTVDGSGAKASTTTIIKGSTSTNNLKK